MALCYFEKHYYDLIILDIGLPDISGFEVARRIRASEALQNKQPVPIIALTAHLDHKNNSDFLEAGIQTVISKPLTKVIALNILKKFVYEL
jgi:DNA-binding response OmpR family regulator